MSDEPTDPQPGDRVTVIDGPFTDLVGVVDEVNAERRKLRLTVSMFGRSTTVELDFAQVVAYGMEPPKASIAVIGVGQGGWDAARHLSAASPPGVRVLVADTDPQALGRVEA